MPGVRPLLAALAAVAAVAVPGPAHAAPVVLAAGHADLGPRLADGAWRIGLRDDAVRPPVWRALEEVTVHAVEATRTTVPDATEFGFLGPAGGPVWVLPQTQRADAVWLGWNTQDPSVATAVRRELTWRVHGVSGPGRFVLFLTGNFGAPDVVFDSGRAMPQDSGVEVGTHVHGNWAFTAAGTYLLDIEMAATDTAGAPLGARGTLRFFVGAGDPTTAAPAADRTTTPAAGNAAPAPAGGASRADAAPWARAGAAAVAVLLLAAVGAALVRRSRRATGATP
ncbi:hypothetical protein Val02_61380 [Virgisporangium aliadipatigenens]|uniref:ABC transporter-associated repeat protein n=1 Tax=Virgisporangium aliadipatigenens TaxID=741659 RepID=A0A8J3YRP5_9ACTN|nr:choice-of-anchor M domain-containing protein [Virgisporangium aliadipatigenens]GIJ49252.1 hypothetical protein Val02_61380 [Virgisporangium aliadipatigenens]